ncbi:P-loop containing nucleoside triphosphate hydrolase protein [Trametes versicolor FP-101664 SS1]|uniref:P-loop containing nucleoside triphosphate hydrolase protein n=1 Tax=Trametes versicolor (strain FP-101664) TaxID=717944 RepID=UPI000462177A|nr:P-loop containing nucleoside triphosphate hydrolase protein [Trametes versicolor FP-101664 SS1]EIW60996.1 P-loop containing nucleoside triphosphate hydrolase protein [Trametes versicolor FP-101664 SS1]
MDQHYTKILFEWANHPEGQAALLKVIPQEIVSRMQALFRAADLSHNTWEYPLTRRSRPRKFIMHVGPTNSGKTHNALRALAAAKRGIYAGPLRLLAYEIFDRLNKGQIVPLGMEPDPEDEPDSQSNIDLGEAAVTGQSVIVTKSGNPKYARPCNMVTGEEQKIVSDNAPLLSCTVEMTPHLDTWDVAVIDEIQLIADKNRGGAWTSAVLGINAAEIHLCGEESAIPVIEAIIRDLGDTLEINRYERLTPLVVAEESLGGDLSKVQKGDCAVAFSRTGIFGMKSRIEEENKMRCALAYGRLPPEIRAEQAALFNDPKSDYDVLVGSDAIGMGLNLKIKRVIFEAVAKFDGGRSRVMSSSQIKQIAGRAGRFGMHGDDTPGGVVTTLHAGDLEIVRKALAAPYEPIRYARISMGLPDFLRVVRALPPGFSQMTVADVFVYVSKLHPRMEYHAVNELETCFKFIDQFIDCLTLENRLLAQNAPCPWRDDNAVRGAQAIMELHREHFRVSLEGALQRAGILKNINNALVMMENDSLKCDSKQIVAALAKLETVHKVIVLYLWYSYRFSVAFPDQAMAFELRRLTELAMDWCLEVLHQMRINAPNPAVAARKSVLERRSTTGDEIATKRESRRHEKLLNVDGLWQNIVVR